MAPSVLLAMLLVSVPLGYLVWSLLSVDRKSQRATREILALGTDPAELTQRAHSGLLERAGYRLTPSAYVRKLDRLLSLAGRPASLPLGRVLAAKPLLGLLGALLGFWIGANGTTPILKLVGIFVFLLGYFIPDLLLYSKGQERQKILQLELANTLDQMLISVEAGLGFEGAMARAGENGKGPLAEELIRTLQDMQVGRSRRESYVALAERTNVPELRSFVQAVVQADTYGIAISRVLRVQAKVMRVKRRQRAEEKAMKLPVTILFPLLFFIFPVLFIAILGPAVINAIDTFSGQ
ncbi:type II secretion system F family protein [Arthrobacter sp. H-02-3]|uniref:type II secretion system F family protein n=1 Tax=Arthrobacter sp. H-02-3 TaxID=2703675 RepID=UPI000DD229E2|nr:type II secretion system F family protein [Arthrobacter sp. H-02-3]PVZ60972.1 secretion system protein [Arthrobacter sp. H-02-3]